MKMNLFKNKKIVVAILMSVFITGEGCRKTFDINHDPNNPSLDVGTPKIVFPIAVMGVAGVEGGDLALVGGILGEYVTQAASASQYLSLIHISEPTRLLSISYA